MLRTLPGALRSAQRVFDSTGGLHAAGRVPAAGTVLMVSGRASFEVVQKAAMAGVPTLAAVSAPSSLAAEPAEDEGITLFGFLRGDSMNVYTRPDRLTLDRSAPSCQTTTRTGQLSPLARASRASPVSNGHSSASAATT